MFLLLRARMLDMIYSWQDQHHYVAHAALRHAQALLSSILLPSYRWALEHSLWL
jgi:hypothetical protein